MFSYLDFSFYFKADYPNRFFFSLQNTSAAEVHGQKHFLIAKTAAKTTRPSLFCHSFESCSFTPLYFIKHCLFNAVLYKNKALATCSHRLTFLNCNHPVFLANQFIHLTLHFNTGSVHTGSVSFL